MAKFHVPVQRLGIAYPRKTRHTAVHFPKPSFSLKDYHLDDIGVRSPRRRHPLPAFHGYRYAITQEQSLSSKTPASPRAPQQVRSGEKRGGGWHMLLRRNFFYALHSRRAIAMTLEGMENSFRCFHVGRNDILHGVTSSLQSAP